MALTTRPTMVDDSGLFTDGTVVNKDFIDDIFDQIDDQNHSITNPTIKPKAITDEVVAARGNLASLGARLDGVVDDNGVPVPSASSVTTAQAASFIGKRSLAKNDEMATWPSGAAAAPGDFTLSGTGAAVARTGAGEADTTTLGAGTYAAKLTFGSAEAKLTQSVLSAADVTKWSRVKGKTVFVGIICKASVANQASLVVDDGVTTTRGGSTGNGTYHTGDGSTGLIYALHTISGSATKLEFYLSVASSGAAYFGGIVVVFSDVALLDWGPRMTTEALAYTRVLYASGAQFKAVTPGNDTDTGFTYTLPANTLKNDGDSLEVSVKSKGTGGTNTTVTLALLLGADTITFCGFSSAARHEGLQRVVITRRGASNQEVAVACSDSGAQTVAYSNVGQWTRDLTTALTLKITHKASSAGDYLSVESVKVVYYPALP